MIMKENLDFDLKMEHSDITGQNAVNTIYKGQPEEHVICPICGEVANLDPDILTSMPPQRRIRCPHCGYVGSDFCHNLQIFYGDTPKKNQWPHDIMPEYKAAYTTQCIICGDRISVSALADEPSAHVCEGCKKAILRLRKMLEEDND